MLWAVAFGWLILVWGLGFFAFQVGGGPIHALIAVAVIVIVWRLAAGRRVFGV